MTVEPAAPRADRAAVAWIVIGCIVATYCAVWALATVWAWDRTDGDFQPFTDAITYLAAGERLNAGHDLYRLVPGDRQVLIIDGIFSAPLVSPPPIAVLWRPLAALGFGQSLWIVACWTVLLATVVYVVARGRWVGVALALVLAPSVADQLAAANVASFFPALLIIAWRLGDSVWTGASLAAMAALKLSPVAMVAWLVGIRARRAIAAWLVAFTVLIVIGALGAGMYELPRLPRRREIGGAIAPQPVGAVRHPLAVVCRPVRRHGPERC